jgi:hypothetical protein
LPVSGNLFHHAIELYLKGDLCRDFPRSRLRSYGHNLKRLWVAYKARHPVPDLSKYDLHIRQLHKFERIRYPDSITDEGLEATISFAGPPPTSTGGPTLPTYHLVVHDLDRLIRVIFTTTSLNPEFFFGKLSAQGRAILQRDNPAFPAA